MSGMKQRLELVPTALVAGVSRRPLSGDSESGRPQVIVKNLG
jgi:hypothetical protein